MFCSNCGKEINDTSRFCCFCGAKVISIKKSMTNKETNSHKNINKFSQSNDSSSFIENLYGINFRIPADLKTTGGADNEHDGGIIMYSRQYSGRFNFAINVATNIKGYWDLSINRQFDDVEMIINGHKGIYNPSLSFRYIVDERMVVIVGANKRQLQDIIIE
jgi:hypothetical protein